VKRKIPAKKAEPGKIAKKGRKKADSSHVPLDLQAEREKAALIVQKVEKEIGVAPEEESPAAARGIVLEPLPKKDIPEQAKKQELPPVQVVQAKEPEVSQPPKESESMGDFPLKKGRTAGILAQSLLFAIAGALIAGSLLYLAKVDLWLLEEGVLGLFVLTLAVSYIYLRSARRD